MQKVARSQRRHCRIAGQWWPDDVPAVVTSLWRIGRVGEGRSPTTISWQELENAVLELAVATEIYESYAYGCRHDIALALAGLLRRAGRPQNEAESFIEKLARAHRDNEIGDRRRCVKDSYVMEIPFGLPRLAELTNESTAKCVARWIGYHEKTSSATAPNGMSLENGTGFANSSSPNTRTRSFTTI